MDDQVFLVNSASFDVFEVVGIMTASVNARVDLSNASYVSGTFVGMGQSLTLITASYIVPNTNITASTAQSASYIIPGATFYQVSGSNGVPASYIEPYDYSKDNVFRPASKEGRTYWDHKWVNWKVWQDTDYSGSTAAALNLNLGRELNFAVHNPTNATLARGTPVYLSGSQTSSIYPFNQTWPQVYKPDVYKAVADGTGLKSDVVGLVRSAIPAYHDGYICIHGTMHNTNVESYGDVLGTELWLSTATAGSLTTTKPAQPYEIIKIGWLTETGSQGTILIQISEEPAVNAYAGMTSIPTIMDALDSASADFTSSLYVSSASVNLYNNVIGSGIITQYLAAATTVSLAPGGETSYVYATTNGSTASYEITTDLSSINQTNRVPVATVYRADADAHWVSLNQEGLALANKLNSRLLATEPFSRESGLALAETGSRFITITEGALWTGATRFVEQPFDSRLTGSDFQSGSFDELHIAYHSASVWVTPVIASGQYYNGYYDDGTNLVALGPNSYSINYIFRIFGENNSYDEDAFIILSDAQYSTIADAQASNLPANIPAVLSDISLNVGRIIIQSGSNTASLVESAFGTTFGASVVTNHNNLAGLQGGQGGEYYHLKTQEYSDFQGATGTGVYVRQNNPTISGSITTASFVTLSQTASFVITAQTASFVASVKSASYADTASWAINAINGGTSLTTASLYIITASWAQSASNAVSASWAPGGSPTTVPSASWVSASAFITTAQTASFVASANVVGTVTSASFAITASYYNDVDNFQTVLVTGSLIPITASFANNVVGGYQTALTTGSTIPITASWATTSSYTITAETSSFLTRNRTYEVTSSWAVSSQTASFLTRNRTYEVTASAAVTSSYVKNADSTSFFVGTTTMARGCTFYNALGIAGTPAANQNVIVWRAPFAATATAIWGYIAGGTASTASINARRNGIGTMSPSNTVLTASNTWASSGSISAASASFVTGDRLEIMLITSSNYPTQVAVQVDFTRAI